MSGNPSFYSPLITRYLPGKYMVNKVNYWVITNGNKKVNTEEIQLKYLEKPPLLPINSTKYRVLVTVLGW